MNLKCFFGFHDYKKENLGMIVNCTNTWTKKKIDCALIKETCQVCSKTIYYLKDSDGYTQHVDKDWVEACWRKK